MTRIKFVSALALIGALALSGCRQNTPSVPPTQQPPVVTTPTTPTTPGVSAPYEGPSTPVAPPLVTAPVDTATDYKAVLIGINKYPNAPLSGCVNDVIDMAAYLVRIGVPSSSIRIIKDEEATTARIQKEMAWLVEGAKEGSVRLFHYSGHGAEYASANNAGQPNGMNQIICPVDFDWTPGHMITDRQFVDTFSRLPDNVLFNWISDSCHSGDLTRQLPRPGEKFKRYPNTPPAQVALQKEAKKKFRTRGFVGGVLDVGYVSGCKSDELSADSWFGNRPNGALTYNLLIALNADAARTVPLRDIVKYVNDFLDRDGYDQNPQAEGARVVKPFLK